MVLGNIRGASYYYCYPVITCHLLSLHVIYCLYMVLLVRVIITVILSLHVIYYRQRLSMLLNFNWSLSKNETKRLMFLERVALVGIELGIL